MRVAKRLFAVLLALAAGGINALFGGGGGMLVVPAAQRCLGLEERKAHATSVAVMLPLTLCSTIVYSLQGIWDLSMACAVGGGTLIGGALGAFLLKKVPKGFLSALFYGVMIYVGIRYLR